MRRIFLAIAVAATLLVSCSPEQKTAQFNVATYNLRQHNHIDSVRGDGWLQRYPVIAGLVAFHEFDIFGTQEGFKHQLEDLKSNLPGYDYIGRGRDDGKEKGEYAAIFYRTDMFEVLDSGDFWLSETPDQPGLGWDAACPRICTWGRFRHVPSGKEFMYFNLHMDHVGKQARIESAGLVKNKIRELGNGLPAMVSGDFNVDQTHKSYATLLGNDELRDAYQTAQLRYALNGTFNNYQTDGYTTSRIDHIFVTPGIKVKKYGVLTDTYRTPEKIDSLISLNDAPAEIEVNRYSARTPSDHFPVKIQVEL